MAFTASNGRTQTALADINITPLVDVVLVLLIIFMVTAPVLQSGIDVSVPKTRTVKEITEERMVITINKDQKVFLGNEAININEIGTSLKKRIRDPRNQLIFVRADENVPFGAFATVMDAVKQSGISNVSIVTQPLDQSGSKRLNLFRARALGPAAGLVGGAARCDHGRAVGVLGRVLRYERRNMGRWRRGRGDRRKHRDHRSDRGESRGFEERTGQRIEGRDEVAGKD